MTTGNRNRTPDLVSGRFYEYSWSGADRPRVQYPKRIYRTVERYGVKTRLLVNASECAPVKRALDVPHNYSKTWNDTFAGHITNFKNGNCENASSRLLNLGQSYVMGVDNGLVNNGTQTYYEWTPSSNYKNGKWGKLREKLSGSDFNMSVFLGEGHQTLGLIADSAHRIYKAMGLVKKGRLPQAAAALVNGTGRQVRTATGRMTRVKGSRLINKETLAQNWLELQYGWLPLLSDAHDGAETLAHMLNVPAKQKYSVTGKLDWTYKNQFGTSYSCDGRNTVTWERQGIYKLTVIVSEAVSAGYQLGLENPELVLWELLPWSFVIDWFIPIGQWMDARATSHAVKGTWIESKLVRGTLTGATGVLPLNGAYARRGSFTRTVSSEPPDVELPAFKGLAKVASWQHCANALALLYSSKASRDRYVI